MNRTNAANLYLCVSNPTEVNGDTCMGSIIITDQIKAMCQNSKYGPDSYDELSNISCDGSFVQCYLPLDLSVLVD